MRCEIVDARDTSADAIAKQLREFVPAGESVREPVAAIIAEVRARGDEAVREFTRRFDSTEPHELSVTEAELAQAADALPSDIRSGLERAITNVETVARAGIREDRPVTLPEGHAVVLREAPVEKAAVYVPGGRAPYPSTVIMGVTTARVAGVDHIAVCAPPGPDGDIDPIVRGACHLAGAHTVYRMGGAQAIAALAYGTESVTPVDVIVGPGNLYVQEAKQLVFGQVGIDGFAGPSDILIIADADADPELVTLDLLAQAEHGPSTIVVSVSPDPALLDAMKSRIEQAPDTGAVARLVHASDPEQALAIAEAFAPEHLQLIGTTVEPLASQVHYVGSLAVGSAGATAFGDYIAGSNHVLPTGGAARFASSLSPLHFRRRFTEVRIGAAAGELARAAAPIARAEGFEWHARSMEARIRDNGSP